MQLTKRGQEEFERKRSEIAVRGETAENTHEIWRTAKTGTEREC